MRTNPPTKEELDKARCYNREWMRCYRAGRPFDKSKVEYDMPRLKTKFVQPKRKVVKQNSMWCRKGFCEKCGIKTSKENIENCKIKDCPNNL